ncbi:MAG: pyrroloquinoline quinone-dependent dehydrogenase [Gammaproteobacteria bacterium]|nr:pyrroloquinoline quinone-dependent dehydrogenase [Gammaproteobacteria bacterium]
MRARILISWLLLATTGGVLAGDWPAFGNDPGGSQYSPLDQIDRRNAKKLRIAWEHRSGDLIEAPGLSGTNYEVTPIHVNGRLYYCTPLNKVIALDPATGEELWRFDGFAVSGDKQLIPGACRGVAYWSDAAEADATRGCQRRIFKGDMMGRLWALDADSGQPCADFGAGAGHIGFVDTARDFDNRGAGWWSLTSPPVVFEDFVITGSAMDDTLAAAQDGILRAFDVRTGALRWSFNPVPAELSDTVGGGNVWSTMSVDTSRGLLFVPTTSLSTDYFGGHRGAGSAYADAVVALDIRTGKPRWHRQLIRHDLFDYDLAGHPLLVTISKDGNSREVAIQAVKTGDIFVLDRETGEPVFPIEDQDAPASDIPGETSAPSQPRSVGIEPVTPQQLTDADMFGLTVFDRDWCRRSFAASRYDGLFTPPSTMGSIIQPSIRGGPNWGSVAYHPGENLLLVRAENLATRVQLFQPEDAGSETVSTDYFNRSLPLRGTPWWVRTKPFLSPLGLPCTAPPWGTLTAIDMETGQHRWQIPLGQARGFGVNVPDASAWGSPGVGGPLVTAGGVVFISSGMDANFRAFDLTDGRQLLKRSIPAPGMAVPMTFMVDDRQFIVIAAGGNALAGTKLSDAIVAFAIRQQ